MGDFDIAALIRIEMFYPGLLRQVCEQTKETK